MFFFTFNRSASFSHLILNVLSRDDVQMSSAAAAADPPPEVRVDSAVT